MGKTDFYYECKECKRNIPASFDPLEDIEVKTVMEKKDTYVFVCFPCIEKNK